MSKAWEKTIRGIGNIAVCLAVFLWTSAFGLVLKCEALPPLLLVGLMALGFGLLQALKTEMREGWRLAALGAPVIACLFEAAFGIGGTRLFNVPAILRGDPVDVSNLAHLWLAGVVVVSMLLEKERFTLRHWLGLAAVVIGIGGVLHDGLEIWHVFAVVGALTWGTYVFSAHKVEGADGKASALGSLGIGALLIYVSFISEFPWPATAGSDLLWVLTLVLLPNIGFLLWKFGSRYSAPETSKIAVLFMPVGSIIWYVLLGVARVDAVHWANTLAIAAGGLLLSPYVFKRVKTDFSQENTG